MHGFVTKDILKQRIQIPEKPPGEPELFDNNTRVEELFKCSHSPVYFVHNYVKILDDRSRQWVDFKLYPAQATVLNELPKQQYVVLLKTRQFGASTLIGGAYFLWLLLFSDNAHNLILSKSEREAHVLMGDRFKPMYRRLPSWMKPEQDLNLPDSKTEFELSNGGKMFSLPTSAGDSYTARACVVDEAALVHRSRTNLSDVLLAVQPTIAAGGQLILISKADKSRPQSTFNSLFLNAVRGENRFFPIFAPWQAVPWRTKQWYDEQMEISKSIDGTLDFVRENYPETYQEALAPKELDKRLTYQHIKKCYYESAGLTEEELLIEPPPSLPGLTVYALPSDGRQYVITADAAEGNPKSDYSTAIVWDWETGEECAVITGRFEPVAFSQYILQIAQYYRLAPVFPERNNHGHAVIQWLQEYAPIRVLRGPDSTKYTAKYGYNTNSKYKALGYVALADRLRDEELIIHNQETYRQLQIIEGRTLRAPKSDHDDHAICAMLFAAARKFVHLDFLLEFV
jgi:hypothetical protein